MKANELRIGNLINVNGQGNSIFTIDYLSTTSIGFKEDIDSDWDEPTYDEVSGIELTEEWLLRFGFRKGILFDTILYLSGTRWHISYHDGIYQLNYKENPSSQWVPVLKDIKHVHTLQNLYFALTGEELTFQTEK